MRVVVIGASGTIGGAVADALGARHEVVRASRRGPVRVDVTDAASVEALFEGVGAVDAVVCCAESGALAPLEGSSDEEYWSGLGGKLVGQVNLVRRALPWLRDGGSVTLTGGLIPDGLAHATLGHLVNAGLVAFVRAAEAEMPRGVRLNVVSPGWVRETLVALGMDPADGTPAADVARVYAEAVEGAVRGRSLEV
ncbi:short chain dehydrogenase [Streptomyces avicenniae]|uniref:short chain dehydrogenase n=1 Tax=Streptomyces avicenniae TaxID=500153 RepID=UPI00069BAF40|nr:short chain dehydrogenase [Streptomyces avicenniae]